MTNRDTILNELKDLKSTLLNIYPQNIYKVPYGYFDGLADEVLKRIKTLETSNAKDELLDSSPLPGNISREMPYVVPSGYFENLCGEMMQHIHEHADYRTSDEEIVSLSPLLNSISKKTPFTVPAGYFENLSDGIINKEVTKIISISSRKWYRFVVAASVIGIIAMVGLLFFTQKQIDPNKNPQAWVEKNMKKKVSQQQLDEFVTLANEDENLKDLNESESVKSQEIKELMKDVSEKDIQEFLNETLALESKDAADVLLN